MAVSSLFYKFFKSLRNREVSRFYFGALQHVRQTNTLSVKFEENTTRSHNIEGNALEKVSEDLSSVTPYFSNTFNLAAYVNNSECLKNLVNLNVNLSKIEKKPHIVEKILKLDFDKQIKQHILFLSDFVGMDEIGNFITKNPMILCEDLEDLEVRVNYLESKGFTPDQIQSIVTRNPYWLMFSTVRIDRRLGHFQNILILSGKEVRYLATKQPKLITYNLHSVKCNLFVIKEEMGFEDTEIKEMILNKPRILMINQKKLIERFSYIHNVMKISHKEVLNSPEILFCRNFRIKQRHIFLEKLGRAQYDPKKENFIPIKSLVENTDTEFCRDLAKCSISDFNMFLKTL